MRILLHNSPKKDCCRMTTERYLYKIIADSAVEHLTPEGRVVLMEIMENTRKASIEVLIDTIQSDFGTDADRTRYMTISDALLDSFLGRLSDD